MLVRQATTRECDRLFREKIRRHHPGERFDRYRRRHAPFRAAITFLQKGTPLQGATPQTVTFGSACTSGSVIVAAVLSFGTGGGNTISVSDPTNGTYTAITPKDTQFTNHSGQLFYVSNTAATALTLSGSDGSGSNHLALFIAEFSGLSTTLDGSAATTTHNSTATPTTDAITTANANDLLLSLIGDDTNANSSSAGSGWSDAGTISGPLVGTMEYKIVSSTGSYSGTVTFNAAETDWVGVVAALKATAAGGLLINTDFTPGAGGQAVPQPNAVAW
jgi:hypothetical protein